MEAAPPAAVFALEILQEVTASQGAHGLKTNDYARYRHYCARRLHRVRRALHIRHGRARYQKKTLTADAVTSERHFLLPLVAAERAWSYYMQLKHEAVDAPFKRPYALQRLRKAVKHSAALRDLCKERGDVRTALEAEAYHLALHGNLLLELAQYQAAIEHVARAKVLYEQLAQAVPFRAALYLKRSEELETSLRFCRYNLALARGGAGDAAALSDLSELQRGSTDLAMGEMLREQLEHVRAAAVEQQSKRMHQIVWQGRSALIRSDKLRRLVASAAQVRSEVADTLAAAALPSAAALNEEVVAAFDRCANAYGQAARSAFDEWKSAQRSASAPEVAGDAGAVYQSLQYDSLGLAVRKYTMLAQHLRAQFERSAESVKAVDIARIYKNLAETCADVAKLDDLSADTSSEGNIWRTRQQYFHALRCYFTSHSYIRNERFPDAGALLQSVVLRSLRAADELLARCAGGAAELAEDVARARQLAQALLLQVRAAHAERTSAVSAAQQLQSLSLASKPAAAGAAAAVPLLAERLNVFNDSEASLQRLAAVPPAFEPMPCKPLFFDIALEYVVAPDLSSKLASRSSKAHGHAAPPARAAPAAAAAAPAAAAQAPPSSAADDAPKKGFFSSLFRR